MLVVNRRREVVVLAVRKRSIGMLALRRRVEFMVMAN